MDNLTKEQRKKNMQNIRSTGTLPERVIKKELRKQKIYFSDKSDNIFGRPDIVFRRKKVAVFIDSDFWHGHPKRFIRPKTNTNYWDKKIQNNKKRDLRVSRYLRSQGWSVIRIWEFDIKKSPQKCVHRILRKIGD